MVKGALNCQSFSKRKWSMYSRTIALPIQAFRNAEIRSSRKSWKRLIPSYRLRVNFLMFVRISSGRSKNPEFRLQDWKMNVKLLFSILETRFLRVLRILTSFLTVIKTISIQFATSIFAPGRSNSIRKTSLCRNLLNLAAATTRARLQPLAWNTKADQRWINQSYSWKMPKTCSRCWCRWRNSKEASLISTVMKTSTNKGKSPTSSNIAVIKMKT